MDLEDLGWPIAIILVVTLLLILHLAYLKDKLTAHSYEDYIQCVRRRAFKQEIIEDMKKYGLSENNQADTEHYVNKILMNDFKGERSSFKKLSHAAIENGIRGALFGIVTGVGTALSGALLFGTIPVYVMWAKDMADADDHLLGSADHLQDSIN